MSTWLSFQFSFLSFFPLWLSILVSCLESVFRRNQPIRTEILLICFVSAMFAVSGFGVRNVFCKRPPVDEVEKKTVVWCEKQKGVTSDFILACVLPLYTFDFTKWCSVLQFGFVIGSILLLYARHYGCPPNVVLECFGYSCFKCRFAEGGERFVWAKSLDTARGRITLRAVSDSVSLLLDKQR